MTYLIQRQSGYYFRLRIPSDLIPIIDTRELKRSLRTGSLSLAKERAYLLSGRLKKLFRKLRSSTIHMKLTKEHIDGLIRSYIKEALEAEEDERIIAGPVESKEHHDFIMEGFESALVEYKDVLMRSDYTYVEPIIDDEILKPNNLEADKDSLEYKKLCREFTKAQIPFIQIQMQRERGEYPEVNIDKIVSPPPVMEIQPVQQSATPKGPSIGTLKDKWFQENERADLWKPRTHKQYTGHFTVMLQILGEDTPIDSIDHSTVRHIKDSLLKLPAGMNKKSIFQGKTIPEIIEITEREAGDHRKKLWWSPKPFIDRSFGDRVDTMLDNHRPRGNPRLINYFTALTRYLWEGFERKSKTLLSSDEV